jgi:hypothetical protein
MNMTESDDEESETVADMFSQSREYRFVQPFTVAHGEVTSSEAFEGELFFKTHKPS